MANSARPAAANRKDIRRYALIQEAGQQAARVASEFPDHQQNNAFIKSRNAKIEMLIRNLRESPPRVKGEDTI